MVRDTSIAPVSDRRDNTFSIGAQDISQINTDIAAQSIGNLNTDIAAQSVGNLDTNIAAQTVGNLAIDIVAQSIGDLSTDIAAQSVGNLDTNIAAQTVGDLAVDIAAQTIGSLDADITAQSVGDLAIDVAAQTIGNIDMDVAAQSLSVIESDQQINSSESVVIERQTKTQDLPSGSGGSERVTLTPPAGEIWELNTVSCRVLSTGGGGSHKMTIGLSGSATTSLLFGESNGTTDIRYDFGIWQDADVEQLPTREESQTNVPRGVRVDENNGVSFFYENLTSQTQTQDREYEISARKLFI